MSSFNIADNNLWATCPPLAFLNWCIDCLEQPTLFARSESSLAPSFSIAKSTISLLERTLFCTTVNAVLTGHIVNATFTLNHSQTETIKEV